MCELGKPILKKADQKSEKSENQNQNAVCEQKSTSDILKFGSNKIKIGLKWTMSGSGKPFSRKNPIQKNEKSSKNQIESDFFQTPFDHSTLKSILLFRCDQNHYSNLTSEIMKMWEQVLETKRSRKSSGNDSKWISI